MKESKVFKNASWLIGCRIIQAVFSLIISTMSARYLGPSNYGLINYVASIVAFVVPIMHLGLANILVQETVRHPKEEGAIFGTSLVLSVCASIACIIGVLSFVSIANAGQKDVIIVCSLYCILLIFQALELIQYWFQAKYLSKYTAIVSLCAYILVSVYKIFLLVTRKSVYWFAVSNALDYMLIAIALLFVYKKLGGQKLSFSGGVARRMLSVSRHYIVSSLMVTVFAQTDKIMLTLMLGEVATGYYTAAVSCAGVTSFVFSAIIDSMRPKILESQQISKETFELNLSRLYCIITYLSLAQSFCMTFLADLAIFILYGTSYYPAIPALRLVVWYTTFSYYGSVRNIWILAEKKQKYLWIINFFGALTNVLLNAIFIPIWGIVGAAFASLVTQIFTNVIVGFIIEPIRKNNQLMFRGINPKLMVHFLRMIRGK